MVNVTLKGGVVKEFENGTTAMEIAKSLGMGLTRLHVSAKSTAPYATSELPSKKTANLKFLPSTMQTASGHSATPHPMFLLRQLKDFIPTQSLLSVPLSITVFIMISMLTFPSLPKFSKKSKQR